MNLDRRQLLKLAGLFAAAMAASRASAMDAPPRSSSDSSNPESGDFNVHALAGSSNFKAIYGDPRLKAEFLKLNSRRTDREIYALVQSRLPEIKPFLGEFRYALPALSRQKDEMVAQTLDLLGVGHPIDGYLEIGTTGRYAGRLRAKIEIKGDLVLLNNQAPGYSPTDLVERGSLGKLGRFVQMNDYAPVAASEVHDRSLDLIANYIGFHHAPLPKLEPFVASLHRTLRPGGRMIVRDHDVNSSAMNRMVALAHDVFNLGLGTAWQVNRAELRHFTSVDGLVAYLEARGFKDDGRRLFQQGDPTKNALMVFRRI